MVGEAGVAVRTGVGRIVTVKDVGEELQSSTPVAKLKTLGVIVIVVKTVAFVLFVAVKAGSVALDVRKIGKKNGNALLVWPIGPPVAGDM
jgi:hypothetical protein